MNRRRVVCALLALIVAPPIAFAASPPADWLREWPRTDFSRSRVPVDEMRSGGAPKDAIPSIDEARFAPVMEGRAAHDDREPVMSVATGGDARACARSIPMRRDAVNDIPFAFAFRALRPDAPIHHTV